MKKTLLGLILLSACYVQAQQVPYINQQQALPPVPLVNENANVPLSAKEAEGVRLANEWKNNPDKPIVGENGNVKYLYGATMPTMVCKPLQVCSIRLQQGEIVNDVHAGDAVRWKISPATEGQGASSTTLIIVKPTNAGLTTNLIVTTDRRIYTIKLVSHAKNWIPVLSFDYPEDIQREWASYNQKVNAYEQANTMTTGQNLNNLDFEFDILGDSPSWKPLRVYTDGIKTYIQFPSSHFNEAPALVALGNAGEEIINYRLMGDKYVVDKVINRAALIVGVGSDQTKVEIHKR